MRRKIIKQGNNTLTVTLPSSWAKKFDVIPGSEVEVDESKRDIIISPTGKSLSKSISIDITNLSTPAIWRYISSAYRAGYDEIKVNFDGKGPKKLYTAFTYNTMPSDKNVDLSPIEAIQALVNRFVGVEIIDQKHNQCTIKELVEISPKEFDNALNRIFNLLKSMSEILDNALNGQRDELNEILIVDTNLDRFEDFYLRVLNKNGYSEYKKTQAVYSTVFFLEILGDEFKKVALHLIDIKKPSKSVKTFYDHINGMCESYFRLFYKFNKEDVDSIYKKYSQIPDLFNKLTKRMNKEEIEVLNHLKRVGRFICSLAELRIDMEYM